MREVALFALIFCSLTACGSIGHGTSRLDGVWISDRSKTLANIDASGLPEERLQFLRRNLGELRYCFKGDRTAALFPGTTKEEVVLSAYWVNSETRSSVTVKTNRSAARTLHIDEGCFHHDTEWGYKEYFCRKPGMENPCG